jgi:serine/threonine-protein kinase
MSGQVHLGRYVLERRLAAGGMAEIWLAHQAGPAGFQKDVVVKRILPHLASDRRFVEMFLDEARNAARLDHPNIVQIFDLGESDGDYYIAMEYVDGWDLEAIIDRSVELRQMLHPAICAWILAASCAGLDYAHHFKDRSGTCAGLVHRDVSPQNIRVSRGGSVKVMDFGIAKARTSSHKTQTGAVKGKLSYMSPEQIQGQELDGRSDIFALGIVLYEMLTSQRPFGHESELLAVTAIMHQSPRAIAELAPHIPGELEQIVLRCLAKDRTQRFQTASELQLALEQYLRSEGVLLTARDIAEYLADLFSPQPTGQIAALQRSSYAPMSLTAQGQSIGGPTRVNHAAGLNTLTQEQAVGGRRISLLLVMLLGLLMLGVLGAGATLFWLFLLRPSPPTEGAPNGEAVPAALATDDSPGGTGTGPQLAADDAALGDPSTPPGEGSAGLGSAPAGAIAVPGEAPPSEAAEAIPADPAPGEGALAQDPEPGDVENPTGTVEAETDAPEEGSTEDELAPAVDAGEPSPAEADVATGTASTTSADAGSGSTRRPPTPRPPQPVTGTLRINLQAAGEIFVNGRSMGRREAGNHSFPLPPGDHSVRVVGASGVERSQSATVQANQTRAIQIRF